MVPYYIGVAPDEPVIQSPVELLHKTCMVYGYMLGDQLDCLCVSDELLETRMKSEF